MKDSLNLKINHLLKKLNVLEKSIKASSRILRGKGRYIRAVGKSYQSRPKVEVKTSQVRKTFSHET